MMVLKRLLILSQQVESLALEKKGFKTILCCIIYSVIEANVSSIFFHSNILIYKLTFKSCET